MRTLFVLLSAVFVLTSCTKNVQMVESTSNTEPVVLEEKTMLELRLSEEELSRYSDTENGIWQEARYSGLHKVFNEMLRTETILAPVHGFTGLDSQEGSYTQTGVLTQDRDGETGDIVQSFVVSSRFVGDLDLAGEVVTLEDSRFVSGMTDVAYAMLYNKTPAALPAYVAIAEPIKELGTGFYRLIGMAEVTQNLGNMVQMPADRSGAAGTLCALEVMVSKREIESGDMIFLLSVSIDALDQEGVAAMAAEELETVVVSAPYKDTVPEPKEKK